jgi:hypothetical protein
MLALRQVDLQSFIPVRQLNIAKTKCRVTDPPLNHPTNA